MSNIKVKENYNLLKFNQFSSLLIRWDVKWFFIPEIKSKYNVVNLGDYINEENNFINPFEFPNEDFKILGVNNQTGIFDAYIQQGSEINQHYLNVELGFLAYNPYRINVGSIGLRTDEHKHNLISPAYVVFSCSSKLIPDFLFKIFKTEYFNINHIQRTTTGSVRQILSFDYLCTFNIPLPHIDEQQNLLKNYYKQIHLAEIKETQSDEIEKRIDVYLFEEIGVVQIEELPFSFKLSFIDFKNINRWGVTFNKNSNTPDKLLKSDKYPNEPIHKFVEINPQTSFANTIDIGISFLPMECISDEYGEVIVYYEGKIENSNGYTKFIEGDLLWSKITPCMQNGKSVIVKNLKNGLGYGSTEYHVLRNKSDILELEYLYHILRTNYIRKQGVYHFSGSAGQQRVPAEFLKELYIPLPPLEKQKEIATQIQKWKIEIKSLREQAKALREIALKEFEKEIFY